MQLFLFALIFCLFVKYLIKYKCSQQTGTNEAGSFAQVKLTLLNFSLAEGIWSVDFFFFFKFLLPTAFILFPLSHSSSVTSYHLLHLQRQPESLVNWGQDSFTSSLPYLLHLTLSSLHFCFSILPLYLKEREIPEHAFTIVHVSFSLSLVPARP
jgi:hypothetical protein